MVVAVGLDLWTHEAFKNDTMGGDWWTYHVKFCGHIVFFAHMAHDGDDNVAWQYVMTNGQELFSRKLFNTLNPSGFEQ